MRAIQIGPVGVSAPSTVIGAVSALPSSPRASFFADVLRLEESQNRLAVALVEVVGLGDGFGPVFAVTIAGLQHPSAVRLVAPVQQLHAARELGAAIGLAPDGELQPRGAAFKAGVADLARHVCVPGFVPMVCGNANKSIWHHMGIIRGRSMG